MSEVIKRPLLKLGTVLNEYNLDWDVNKIPLTYEYGGQPTTSPYYGLVRNDNGAILGNCTDEYHIGQNKDIVQALIAIAGGHEFEISNGGALNKGRKIFLQIELPNKVNIGNDQVTRYITALSRHDGKGALAFSLSNKVMSCSNQFNKVMAGAEYKIRHTASMAERLAEMQVIIKRLISDDDAINKQFKEWAHTDVPVDLADDLVTYLLNKEDLPEEMMGKRKLKHIAEMNTVIKSEMATKGENLWGLFNGITYYANHLKQHPTRDNGQIESILAGGANTMMNKAHAFIEAKTFNS